MGVPIGRKESQILYSRSREGAMRSLLTRHKPAVVRVELHCGKGFACVGVAHLMALVANDAPPANLFDGWAVVRSS